MEGRWRGLMENVDNRPWIEYVAILDSRTRPGHRALNGKVFRYDDPFWRTHRPPLGWNCRCRIRALNDRDLERRGITPDQGEGNLKQYTPEAQGYRQPQAGYVDPRTGTETRTDIGWGYDRLEGWTPPPGRYDPGLRPLLERVTQAEAVKDATQPQWPFLTGKTATLDEIKRLGAERLDELLAMKTPDDRSIASILDRGKTLEEVVREASARMLLPAVDVMKWFRGEMIAKAGAIRPIGNVKPSLYQKSGKAVSLMNRAASKLPGEWVDKGNSAGTLDVSVSTKRGFFSEKHWNMRSGRLSRFIRTDDSSTVEHEFMHHIQHADPNLDALFAQEHRRRTANDALEVIYKHLPDETGKPDGYVSRYQGREYSGKPLEVITMAFQAVIGEDWQANNLFVEMLQNDKDMLHLVLGAIFHYKP
jgi:hypothetical protein